MKGRNALHVKALEYLRVSCRLSISDSSYSVLGSGGLKSLMNCPQTTVNRVEPGFYSFCSTSLL